MESSNPSASSSLESSRIDLDLLTDEQFTTESFKESLASAQATFSNFLKGKSQKQIRALSSVSSFFAFAQSFLSHLHRRSTDQVILNPDKFAEIMVKKFPKLDTTQLTNSILSEIDKTLTPALLADSLFEKLEPFLDDKASSVAKYFSTQLDSVVESIKASEILLINKLKALENLSNSLKKSTATLSSDLKHIKTLSSLPSTLPSSNSGNDVPALPKTFAQATSAGPVALGGLTSRYSLKITPLDSKKPIELLQLLRDNIDPSNLKIDHTINLPNGDVLIKSQNPADIDSIKQRLETNRNTKDVVKCFKSKFKSPRIIIYNIDKKFDMDQVTQIIIKQNELFTPDNFRVNFKIPAKTSNHWVLTLVPSLFKVFHNDPFIYFDFSRHSTKEFISIRQCGRCHKLGHVSHQCKLEASCGYCYDKHDTETCSITKATCLNCREHNDKFKTQYPIDHSNKSSACPIRVAVTQRFAKTIDYGF